MDVKGEVLDVLILRIRAVRLQLRERLRANLHVLRLHSDRGGEFSSDLLRDFCCGEGILQSFTLPASPQQSWIAERRIGLVLEVASTSTIHADAPHCLWPFVVRYAAHQLNLRPRVSLLKTSPTLRWTGEVGDASVFRVWGSHAFVRDTSTDKLSARTVPCVFLGFPPDAIGWHFYHPTSRRVFPSQDVTFDESVPFYRLFPYRYAPPPPPPLFLAPDPPPVDSLPPQGPTPSGVSQLDPVPRTAPVEVAVDSGAARGAASEGAASGGAEPGGAEAEGAACGGAEPGDAEPGGAEPKSVECGFAEYEGAEPGGAEPQGTASSGGSAAAGAGDSAAGDTGAKGIGSTHLGGAGVTTKVGGTGGAVAAGPRGARTRGTGAAGSGSVGDDGAGGAGAGDPVEPEGAGIGGVGAGGTGAGGAGGGGAGDVDPRAKGARAGGAVSGGTGAGGIVRPRPSPLSSGPSSVPLRVPPPPESSLLAVPNPKSDLTRAASPTVSRLLATVVTDPSFESTTASALPSLLSWLTLLLPDI
ncbi:unnamed protein product [Closterium sp. NIES-54]